MNPDLKKRDITETDADLAAELRVLFMIRLENLIEKKVKITKKKHWVWEYCRENFATISCIVIL